MATLLKGAPVAQQINERTTGHVHALAERGVTPTLCIIRVGERPDDVAYEKGVCKRAEAVGVAIRQRLLPADAAQADVLAAIRAANDDCGIHGILIFRPLPSGIDDSAIRGAIAPEKDVDGITDGSLAGVFTGSDCGFSPCTAQACMEILDYYGVPLAGRRAVVVGRSLVVGKPAAMLLLRRNATVSICHTGTQDMPRLCREADVLIAAAGRAEMLGAGFLRDGQTVVDVGINFTEDGRMTGDVDMRQAESLELAITPVPGGAGTVTTSVLIGHVAEAALRSLKNIR